jgi:hypothetical protein
LRQLFRNRALVPLVAASGLWHDERVKLRSAWLLALPFLLAGETLGHALAARAFGRDDARHGLMLHALVDYGQYVQAAAALVLVLVAFGLVRRARASYRGTSAQTLPSWRLALLPPAAFLLQEHLERLVQDGSLAWLTAPAPAVVAGAALQVPFGLAALWLVRALLRAADRVAWALARRSAAARRRRPEARRTPFEAPCLRPPALASLHAGRAPPAVA